MKEIIPSEIDKNVVDKYLIEIYDSVIRIHRPSFVNIRIDQEFRITESDEFYRIENSKCVVGIWKKTLLSHITIY